MRSMFSGVSGLRVHQTKMDVIANNISNVNTVGFKSSRVTFNEVFSQTLSGAARANPVTGRGGTNPMQIGLGVSVASIDKVMTGGASQRTDRSLDLMIQGDGFFIVGDASGTYFTRAGAIDRDEAGNLVNSMGLMLMGWDAIPDPLNPGQNKIDPGIVRPIQITGDKQYIIPQPTTAIKFTDNLNAVTKPEKDSTITFYDTVGNKYTVDVKFEYDKGNGRWDFSMGNRAYVNGDRKQPVFLNITAGAAGSQAVTIECQAMTDPPQAFGYVKLNDKLYFTTGGKHDANPTGKTDALSKLTMTITAAANVLTPNAKFGDADKIAISFNELTQFGEYTANASSTALDGNKPGELIGISVDPSGKITGRYSNGQTKLLAQIPVAIFSNPAGLEKIGDNLFVETQNSGSFDGVGAEVQSGGGKMMGGVLEMSNVDLSNEFTEMITTQRGFQANSRIITTSDEMLQELVNLKR